MQENDAPTYQQQLDDSRQIWDAEAHVFDNQPDHGLGTPAILTAWTNLLKTVLPSNNQTILDIGCGTGSLSVVLAGLGHTVTGIDLSPEMISRATAKAQAAGYATTFRVMDAAFPQLASQTFDTILCRHLLWTLLKPREVLLRWTKLLKPGGRLILIEGFWHTGAGLHDQEILDMLPGSLTNVTVQHLSQQADLWGQMVNDERYVITADFQP